MNQTLKARLFLLLGALLGAIVAFLLGFPVTTGVAFGGGISVPLSILSDKQSPLKQRLILSSAVSLLLIIALLGLYYWRQ